MSVRAGAEVFLGDQTVGSLLRNSFRVYFANFRSLAGLGLLFITPGTFVYERYNSVPGQEMLAVIGNIWTGLAALPLTVAVTILVSDVRLGHKASVRRALSTSVSRSSLAALGATVILTLGALLGLILLVVPGVIFVSRYMLAVPAIVIEKIGVRDGLRRSRELGKGFYWRNVSIYGFILLLVISVSIILPAAIVVPFLLTGNEAVGEKSVLFHLLVAGTYAAMTPLQCIPAVLVYYDMRARSEGDATRMLEDLSA